MNNLLILQYSSYKKHPNRFTLFRLNFSLLDNYHSIFLPCNFPWHCTAQNNITLLLLKPIVKDGSIIKFI